MQETKQLEYKEKYSKEECLKSVSAFSNEEGGSIILVFRMKERYWE